MTVEIIKERNCNKCGVTRHVKLVRNIAANGTSQIYWWCVFHEGAASEYIPHDKLKAAKIEIDSIPIVENYSTLVQCEVCGALGAELHHFAPKYLFGDEAEDYPKSYLCDYHHTHWHNLVTPNMSHEGSKRD